MKNLTLILLLLLLLAGDILVAQADTTLFDLKEKRKKGWTFGALPVVSYDADQGLQLGALAQVFNYGDGSTYPEYKHTLYAEVSFFTRGSAVFQLFYDSKYLIPGKIRLTADIVYLPERALNFYGFNGYEARYDPSVETSGNENYISRVFYRYERKMFRTVIDLQGPLFGQKIRWLAGVNYLNFKINTVDINAINKGKKEEKQLPDTALLYDQYVQFGLIGNEERAGGSHILLKAGLVFDTRDQETAPNKGIWSEVMLITAPSFLSNTPYGFVKLSLTHRQYLSLVKKYLVFAYRLGYQGTIGGQAPFYLDSYMFSSWAFTTKPDGLGGAKSMRGILRNRVVGEGYVFGNLEMRWKFWRTIWFKQNFYFGLVGFVDGGMIIQDHRICRDLVPSDQQNFYFDLPADRLHLSGGLGLRAALNENFVILVDYGIAFDRRDGQSGLYIGLGHLF